MNVSDGSATHVSNRKRDYDNNGQHGHSTAISLRRLQHHLLTDLRSDHRSAG
jgi:hypothetical protein